METIKDFLKWVPVHEYSPVYEKLILKEDVEKAIIGYSEIVSIAFCEWYSNLFAVNKITLHNPYGQGEVSGGIFNKPIEQLYKEFMKEEMKKDESMNVQPINEQKCGKGQNNI